MIANKQLFNQAYLLAGKASKACKQALLFD
jgi:hypothetical protein